MLADPRYRYPLTLTDAASRYLLCCDALDGTREDLAFTAFEKTFTDFGLPAVIRTDNGIPFASPSATRPSLAIRQTACYILHHMVQYYRADFNVSFAALSDVTRRGVLEQLGRADASITELAEKFNMTLTGMKKHVGVLERAGLVSTEKVWRVRTCTLGRRRLEEEAAWIERYRQLWDARFNELDTIIEELKRKEKMDGHKKRG